MDVCIYAYMQVSRHVLSMAQAPTVVVAWNWVNQAESRAKTMGKTRIDHCFAHVLWRMLWPLLPFFPDSGKPVTITCGFARNLVVEVLLCNLFSSCLKIVVLIADNPS